MNESQKFIKLETISAQLLLGATILAMCLSNSPLNDYYHNLFHTYILSQFGGLQFKSNLLFWVNEGLMTIFFLVVGLEIKYELLEGSLNSLRKAALPGIAAIGGMIVPALIYIGINYHNAIMLRGWAIPTATDIAFALCVLSLLGSRVPSALKVFLTTLAILDDLAAIIIIAFFYTDHLSVIFLGLSSIMILLLFVLNRYRVTYLSIYILMGFALWICLLNSGIHATLAGVILALMIPVWDRKKQHNSPLQKLKHGLHPLVALIILPLFAFANAGVSFLNLGAGNLHLTIILGVLLGLFIGKQIGIFSASWLAVKFGMAKLPNHVRWSEFYAMAVICGIGFTISLFIGSLAFSYNDASYLNSIKIGVLIGSLLSGGIGYLLLQLIHRTRTKDNLT
ncbi:MAG TPA: Na+/H+ antiporter NhaA [Gammaproteobacteria bacterium]|jgi:NhaA family Na+:H+ antiporter|nr:Na+/H+ antiporter NhaA [Gammaproteobacteria bacterium]